MGILDLFKGNTREKKTRTTGNDPYGLKELQRKDELANQQIKRLQDADAQFEKDNDIDKRIQVYESVLDLNQEPLWNSFNQCMTLANMYVSAGKNDSAWRFLNQMTPIFLSYPAGESYQSKIRNQQFKILKKEKKYKDALQMLSISYYYKAKAYDPPRVDSEKFIKEARTTAKGMGLPETQLSFLSREIEKVSKQKNSKESDVINLYRAFVNNNGL